MLPSKRKSGRQGKQDGGMDGWDAARAAEQLAANTQRDASEAEDSTKATLVSC